MRGGNVGSNPTGCTKTLYHEKAGRIITNEIREERKRLIGSRKERKLQKYSDNFNKIFTFFLKSYRSGILTFCGVDVSVDYDPDGFDGKYTFRQFDNGFFNNNKLVSQHPNITKGVIVGKKSWGLHVKMWVDGISDFCFSKNEILNQFSEKNIKIPESLLKDFNNQLRKSFMKKYGPLI